MTREIHPLPEKIQTLSSLKRDQRHLSCQSAKTNNAIAIAPRVEAGTGTLRVELSFIISRNFCSSILGIEGTAIPETFVASGTLRHLALIKCNLNFGDRAGYPGYRLIAIAIRSHWRILTQGLSLIPVKSRSFHARDNLSAYDAG